MARTAQEHSATKQRLLDAAQRLMVAQGFSATTVDEICEAAKLTKGSFFHYFESKDQLGRELLERYCEQSFEQMRKGIETNNRDPLKRVLGYIDGAIALSKECGNSRGCLLGTFAQELSDTDSNMRSLCAKAFSQWADTFRKALDEAKAEYAPKTPINTQSLANHFLAVVQGAKILARAKQDTRVEQDSLRHFKRYLESLFV